MTAAGDANLWSMRLLSSRTRRPRWLGEDGRLTSDPQRALRLRNPELAAQRAQQFLRLHGGDPALLERFALVPAPQAPRCLGLEQPPLAA
jgi:hypothetical protein